VPVSIEAFRAFALSLPEAIEAPHFDRPSFRVRNRIFATLRPGEGRAVLKLSRLEQEALVATDPETFALTPWGHQGWTSVDLARVDAAELRELVIEAWAGVAPKRVVAAAGLPPASIR
jgi:hypothetical protein